MKRNIIQICAFRIPEDDANYASETIYALCDDGTLWQYFRTPKMTTEPRWDRIENIPQHDEEN